MKIRKGFISNSSTTSFCIIGVSDEETVKKLFEKDKGGDEWNVDSSQGFYQGKSLEFYGDCDDVSLAGLNAEEFLQDKTIVEGKKEFQKLLKENFNLVVDIGLIEFLYGEAGSG